MRIVRAEHVISIRKYNKTKVQIRRRGRSDNDLFPRRRPPCVNESHKRDRYTVKRRKLRVKVMRMKKTVHVYKYYKC